MVRSLIAAVLTGLVSLISAASVASEPPTLFDLVKLPAYQRGWSKLLAGEPRPVPVWVTRLSGPATPVETLQVGSDTYTTAFMCEPGNCGTHTLRVIFSTSGANAWGLLLNDEERRWLGEPNDSIKGALLLPQ